MINERTNSSSLMSPAPRVTHTQPLSSHARSYSSTSISLLYSSPSATPSMANAVTNGEGATTTTTNGSINESNDTLQLSEHHHQRNQALYLLYVVIKNQLQYRIHTLQLVLH